MRSVIFFEPPTAFLEENKKKLMGKEPGEERTCTAKHLVLGLGLVALGAWVGFVNHVSHDESLKAPLPEPPRTQRDDDLELAPQVIHEIAADPMKITSSDWSAGGRFTRPDPTAYVPGEYPKTEKLVTILKRWNPDNVTVPTPFRETLQVLNYSDPRERALAEAYRDAEVPFKIFGIPTVETVRTKWTDSYLVDVMDKHKVQFKVERSDNNHFMYWQHKSGAHALYQDWKPPTKVIAGISYAQWLDMAHAADADQTGPEQVHHYLMLGTQTLSSLRRNLDPVKKKPTKTVYRHFVNNDLDIFTPEKENFFVTNIRANKGIQCRFGMRGVIAEAHYDGGRNMVAMLKGAKRYILSPPAACKDLTIIPDRQHPSFRHSTTDWYVPLVFSFILASRSHEQAAETNLNAAAAIDTVVREGEVLYIPSYWIHYIVSLKYSIQCNTRSGAPPQGQGESDVRDCVRWPFTSFTTLHAQVGDENVPEGQRGPPGGLRRRKKGWGI